MDYRDRSAFGYGTHLFADYKRMVLVDELEESEEFEERNLGEIPAKFEVCPTCEGRGTHVNPAIDSHGISSDEFYEDFEFCDAYMKGVYDVPCYECQGKRVVLVPDISENDPRMQEIIRRERDHYNYISEVEAERRRGC